MMSQLHDFEPELDLQSSPLNGGSDPVPRPTSAPSSLELASPNLFTFNENSSNLFAGLDFGGEEGLLKPRANYPVSNSPTVGMSGGLFTSSLESTSPTGDMTSRSQRKADLFLGQNGGQSLGNSNIFLHKGFPSESGGDMVSTSSIVDDFSRLGIDQNSFLNDGSERITSFLGSRSACTSPVRSTSVSTIRNSSSPMSDSGISSSMFYGGVSRGADMSNAMPGLVNPGVTTVNLREHYEATSYLDSQPFAMQHVNGDFVGLNLHLPSHQKHHAAYAASLTLDTSRVAAGPYFDAPNGNQYAPMSHHSPLGMMNMNVPAASWMGPQHGMNMYPGAPYMPAGDDHYKENLMMGMSRNGSNGSMTGLGGGAAASSICKYFAHGRCSKGEHCKYLHIPAGGKSTEPSVGNMDRDRMMGMNSSFMSNPSATDRKIKRATTVKEERKISTALSSEAFGSLIDFQGRILAMSRDQNGCRTLQQQLDLAGVKGLDIIYNEIKDNMVEIMMDSFGNYLFQKIMDLSTDGQRFDIVSQVAPHLTSASVNLHGTRSVQKIVQVCRRADQVCIVVEALRNHVVQLSMDTNGNHVIQRCLQHMSSSEKQFVFDAILSNCLTVATHRHGCCVVQRCLDAADNVQRRALVTQIFKHWHQLMQDAYGNYVVQFVVDKGNKEDSAELMRQLQGHIVELSSQKYSSNVIEKCLKCATTRQREELIREIASDSTLPLLLNHQYGNYVVQSALSVASKSDQRMLVEAILPHLPSILNTSAGRKIISIIQKEYPGKLDISYLGGLSSAAAM